MHYVWLVFWHAFPLAQLYMIHTLLEHSILSCLSFVCYDWLSNWCGILNTWDFSLSLLVSGQWRWLGYVEAISHSLYLSVLPWLKPFSYGAIVLLVFCTEHNVLVVYWPENNTHFSNICINNYLTKNIQNLCNKNVINSIHLSCAPALKLWTRNSLVFPSFLPQLFLSQFERFIIHSWDETEGDVRNFQLDLRYNILPILHSSVRESLNNGFLSQFFFHHQLIWMVYWS